MKRAYVEIPAGYPFRAVEVTDSGLVVLHSRTGGRGSVTEMRVGDRYTPVLISFDEHNPLHIITRD